MGTRTASRSGRLAALLGITAAFALGPAGVSHASGVTVTDLANGSTANAMAQSLAGGGVTISNVTYTGDNRAAGSFTGGTSSIGFGSGIVLDSGHVQTYNTDTACSRGVEGPNNCNESTGPDGVSNSTDFTRAGDTDLDKLVAPDTTNDAAVLNFDFVPQTSTLTFRYVFGSEEYDDFVNAGVNDVFAFYVNGTNCALVPGTTDPVAVDTINSGSHANLFRDNVTPSPSIDSQMDGLTTVLTCTASVNAGQTNHMKLAIADTGDSIFDSAVFVQAGTLVSGNTLTVNKSGAGSGTVTSSPAGINCGATCSHAFTSGTMVTLTPTPDAGSTFAGWSGDCTGTGGCTVTMSQARNVTATFNPLPTYALNVTKSGTGSGTVTSSPAGINCGSTCSHSYIDGTLVTLTASANAGSTFAGWSGSGCSGTGSCQVTMSHARTVTATFTASAPPPPPPPPGIGGPPSVGSGLFCGAQHRGHCTGLKVKGIFDRPGNASWTFDAYNPSPGHSIATAAAKKLRLGQVKRVITKAGTVTVVFKLKKGARTNRLYKLAKKRKLKYILVTLTFTTGSGTSKSTKNVKLKL